MTATIPAPDSGKIIWAPPDTYPVPGGWYGAAADPSGRVTVLHGLFERLGHPDVLRKSREYLQRVRELNLETRQRQEQARQAWGQAHQAFLDGRASVEEYLAAREAAKKWFDPSGSMDLAPAMDALTNAQRDLRARAAALLPAESGGLYQIAQKEAAAAVQATADLPKLPDRCWSAPDPSAAAMELGAEQTYLELQRQQARFALCLQVGALLRQVGGLGAEAFLTVPVPESVGFVFIRWDLAMEGDLALRRLRPALRLRYAVDHGWKPGLYLASDISYPAPNSQPAAGRSRLFGWVSGPRPA
jgi:hypothetical protein